jgi:hypothetical protein
MGLSCPVPESSRHQEATASDVLLKAIEAGTIKHLGRGQYRLTGKRKRAVKEGA